ncbi:Acg family FMN-binding oxidoreductase [Mycobacterium sp. NPDC051804]|uniref:Acg family FMN-binding oxidoreductase n=1 Tax=Mycobacterium sp. NPDC051804 TaxID=3364295 RepID=UPI00379E363A
MTTQPTIATVADAVAVACRAPSVHNSQPWRFIAEPSGLHLFIDTDRLVASDHSGRTALISCGAVLDHLRVAMAAAGWVSHVDRYPDPADHTHLAKVTFSPLGTVTDAQRRRADAILARRTDRLPFAAPREWDALLLTLRDAIDETVAVLDVVDDGRAQLAEAAQLSEALRLYDSEYHLELDWWTGPAAISDGIPRSALVSAAESDRVDIGRAFPVTGGHEERRMSVPEDMSRVLVLSAREDSRRGVLGCGELLSQVLLEATMAGLGTCTLTHVTELDASRDIIGSLVGREFPQLLIRVGQTPALDSCPPPTPRRSLDTVLELRL